MTQREPIDPISDSRTQALTPRGHRRGTAREGLPPQQDEHLEGESLDHGAAARSGQIEGLERFRKRIHDQLNVLETLVRNRAPSQASGTGQEQNHKIAELEQHLSRLRAEADRREREIEAMVEQIEHDRKLLGAAWEHLEREQVEVAAAARVASQSPPSARPLPAQVPAPPPSEQSDLVAAAVFRQFESLQRDVRRNARNARKRS